MLLPCCFREMDLSHKIWTKFGLATSLSKIIGTHMWHFISSGKKCNERSFLLTEDCFWLYEDINSSWYTTSSRHYRWIDIFLAPQVCKHSTWWCFSWFRVILIYFVFVLSFSYLPDLIYCRLKQTRNGSNFWDVWYLNNDICCSS